jgi:hypothetical protein
MTAIVGLVAFLAGAGLMLFYWSRAASSRRNLAEIRSLVESQSKESALETSRLVELRQAVEQEAREWKKRKLTVEGLVAESRMLKGDLATVDITIRKLELERREQESLQRELDRRTTEIATLYLKEVEKSVSANINANNYTACKQRLEKTFEAVQSIGFDLPESKRTELLTELKADFEKAVRTQIAREEQAAIKAKIREEQTREREIQRELQALDRERAAIQAALEKALSDASATHSGEIDRLKARLAEAEEKNRRAIAQAQLTKAGHIYVISNIGSFGEAVYKIGMTRRLDPIDRIIELSDASVPFPFDVHMMISCENAPELESRLHKEFSKYRVNRVNPRKEFFKLDIQNVHAFVEQQHGEVKYVAQPEALEWRQSCTISPEDQRYVDSVYDQAEASLNLETAED